MIEANKNSFKQHTSLKKIIITFQIGPEYHAEITGVKILNRSSNKTYISNTSINIQIFELVQAIISSKPILKSTELTINAGKIGWIKKIVQSQIPL